jgi:hypothetical protein
MVPDLRGLFALLIILFLFAIPGVLVVLYAIYWVGTTLYHHLTWA